MDIRKTNVIRIYVTPADLETLQKLIYEKINHARVGTDLTLYVEHCDDVELRFVLDNDAIKLGGK